MASFRAAQKETNTDLRDIRTRSYDGTLMKVCIPKNPISRNNSNSDKQLLGTSN